MTVQGLPPDAEPAIAGAGRWIEGEGGWRPYVSLMISLISRVVPDGVRASALSRFMISM